MFGLVLASVAFLSGGTPTPSIKQIIEASESCYTAAYVGRMVDTTDDFTDLNDVLPAKPNEMYFGGITSALIKKDYQLFGDAPDIGWVRIIMRSQPLPTTKILVLTNNRTMDAPTVVYWDVVQRGHTRANIEQELKDIHVRRCG